MYCFRSTNVDGCKLELYTGSVIRQFSAVDLAHFVCTREDESLQMDKENAEKMTEDITEALLREKDEISELKDKLMNVYHKLETDTKEMETKHDRLIQICKDLNEEKQTLEELNTVLKSNVLRLNNDLACLQQKEMLLENYYAQQIEARSDTIIDQTRQIKQLHDENERLLLRLSTIAGDRLSHENDNIDDLGDADRPAKLSEVYSELYDNVWTDAFEELTGKCSLSEEKAIDLLLEILLNAFHKCREIIWKRYEVMKSVVVTLNITHRTGNTSLNRNQERSMVLNPEESKSENYSGDPGQIKEPFYDPSQKEIADQVSEFNHKSNKSSVPEDLNQTDETDMGRLSSLTASGQSCGNDMENADVVSEEKKDSRAEATLQLSISVDQEKVIKTLWKQMSNAVKTQALELVRSILLSGLGVNDTDMPNVSRYMISCLEICWKMGLQERPLHLDINAERTIGPERIFDADKFIPYKKTGNKVAYVVWPALFLHEGGQLLTKGIAQGC